MYRKTKYMVYASFAILIILTFVAFAIEMNKGAGKLDAEQQMMEKAYKEQMKNEQNRFSSNQDSRSQKLNTVKVSEDTAKYIFPEKDPLREINSSDNVNFEVPEIPNVNKMDKRPNRAGKVSDYDPFKSEKQENTEKPTKKVETNGYNKNMQLYTLNGSIASDYELLNNFKIGNTEFFVVAHSPLSIQRTQGFTNRKFYVYKADDNNLVQCFELFERQERTEKNPQKALSIQVNSNDTEISYHCPNSVTRTIDNSKLLSPYSEKRDKMLMLK